MKIPKHYKYLFLFLGSFIFLNLGSAQDKQDIKFAKRIEPIAQEYYRIGDYKRALEGYLVVDSIISGNTEYNYRIGICYLNSNFKSKAYPYLEFAYNQDDAPENIFLEMGRAYHYGLEFEKAIIFYESYKMQIKFSMEEVKDKESQIDEIEHYVQMCKNGQRLVRTPILNTSVTNLGPEINSEFADFAPLITSDEKMMILTSKRQATKSTKSDPLTDQFYESIFVSRKNGSSWMKAESIGAPIHHDDLHDAAVGLSPDGNSLFLYLGDDNSFSSQIAGHLYMSNNQNGVWSSPSVLDHINSDSWESHATITGDGNMIVFTSDRTGGKGGTDLYFSQKESDGNWSTPDNMGGYINTKYDEDGPFIHPEGTRLYFSSKGHNSMGGYDVFYSDFLVEKQRWTRPKNLGYPINTADDDIYFVWSNDGQRAYFSSEREDSFGDADIYMLTRDDENLEIIALSGFVKDKFSGGPVTAKIAVRDRISNNLVGIYDTGTDGSYHVDLAAGKQYNLIIEKEGYRETRAAVEMIDFNDELMIQKDFEVRKK